MTKPDSRKPFEKLMQRGGITSAYFATPAHVETKSWSSIIPCPKDVSIIKEDSGVFMDSSDEEQDLNKDHDIEVNENKIKSGSKEGKGVPLTELSLLRSQRTYGGMTIIKCDDRLSVISEKSYPTTESSPRSNTTMSRSPDSKVKVKTKQFKSEEIQKPPVKYHPNKKKKGKQLNSAYKPENFDTLQVYERQNTSELLHRNDKQIPVARASVNRRISTVRSKMYRNNLRESTKKLQDDLRQTMRKYSSEKTQLLKQLSSLRNHKSETSDYKMEADTPSTLSDTSSLKSHSSRYYMAPNLAAHKLSKKKNKKTTETRVTTITETPTENPKEGILKFPTINRGSPPRPTIPRATSKTTWDSGRNNAINNFPPLDPLPGIAAAQDLLKDSFKIPKVQDSTRHDITRASLPSRTKKKKVHFAEKHSVSEYGKREFYENPKSHSYAWSGDTKSLAPLSKNNSYSVDSIKAFSALPPIPGKGSELEQQDVMKATQQYKSLYLKMKDPEERMKTLAEILYSVRLRMMENEQTMKYGINPKHLKHASTLCDFLMNRNHNSSLSMYSEMSQDSRHRPSGIPKHTASRSTRKSGSLQLQNYLRKMSKNRKPSEEARLSRMIAQTETTEQTGATTPVVTN